MKPDAEEPVPPPANHSDECAYELAKDFSAGSNSEQKDIENVYTIPTSNRPINTADNQLILFQVK